MVIASRTANASLFTLTIEKTCHKKRLHETASCKFYRIVQKVSFDAYP